MQNDLRGHDPEDQMHQTVYQGVPLFRHQRYHLKSAIDRYRFQGAGIYFHQQKQVFFRFEVPSEAERDRYPVLQRIVPCR